MTKTEILKIYKEFKEGDYVDTFDADGNLVPELTGNVLHIDKSKSESSGLKMFSIRIRSHHTGQVHDALPFGHKIHSVKPMSIPPFYEDQEIFIEKFRKEGYKALIGMTIFDVEDVEGRTNIKLNNNCIVSFDSGYSAEYDTATYVEVLNSFGDQKHYKKFS